MTAIFGNLPITLPEESPSTPSSGIILSSSNGYIKVTNSSGSSVLVGSTSQATGSILVGSGTTYSSVVIGNEGQIPSVYVSSLIYQNAPIAAAIYHGSVDISSGTATVTNSLITTSTIVVVTSNAGTVLANQPVNVTSVNNGNFVLSTVDSLALTAYYIFWNPGVIDTSTAPVYSGTATLTGGSVVVHNAAITTSSSVIVTPTSSSHGAAVVDISNGQFLVTYNADPSVTQINYMFQ